MITGKIRNKLIAILLGASLGMVLITALALFAMEISRKTINEAIDVDGKILEFANDAAYQIMQARELDQKYLLNYKKLGFANAKAEYADKFEEAIVRVSEKLKQIIELSGSRDAGPQKEGGNKTVTAVRNSTPYLEEYSQNFLESVVLIEKRGLKDSGLERSLRDHVQTIERKIIDAGLLDLQVSLLKMRRQEESYLLYGGRLYIKDFEESVETFKQNIDASTLPLQAKQEIFHLVTLYAGSFSEIVKADQQIASLGKFYRSAVSKIFPELQTILEIQKANQNVRLRVPKPVAPVEMVFVRPDGVGRQQ